MVVEDLEEDDFMECLVYVNEYYMKHKMLRVKDGIEELRGPQCYADKDDPERMLYCGASLQRFPYYAPSVCLAYLKAHAGRAVGLLEATERQFMEALAKKFNRKYYDADPVYEMPVGPTKAYSDDAEI